MIQRRLEELHSVGSLMMTMDHSIELGVPNPHESEEDYRFRLWRVRDDAESIHRHHVKPLIDEVLRLREVVSKMKTDSNKE